MNNKNLEIDIGVQLVDQKSKATNELREAGRGLGIGLLNRDALEAGHLAAPERRKGWLLHEQQV